MEPLKTKYAKETTEAFKKMIKTKQPKKFWVDKGTELKGEFEKLCIKREIIKKNTHSEEKNQRLPKEAFDRYKVLSTSTWSLNELTVMLTNYKILFKRLTHALIE